MQLTIDLPRKIRDTLFPPARYKVLYGGRGGAKSWGIARALLGMGRAKPLRILCAREIQKTISDSVHRLLKDQIQSLGLSDFYTVQETTVKGANGTEFLFAGIRGLDIGKIKSFEGVDICWVEEANTVTKKSWDVLIPTIRKESSEIWISFNPELDTDETYQRFVVDPPQNSIVCKVNWDDNPWFPEVLREEKDSLAKRDKEAFENVWQGNCRSAVDGAIYANEIRAAIESRRIRPVPYDPLLKVHAVWDLGWNDAMCIVMCQRVASSVSVIDYLETSHRTYAEIVAQLNAKPYRWGTDFLPHDGKAKNPQTGKSAIETVAALGRTVDEVPNIGIEEGIRAARQLFAQVYFDETNTTRLVHCLKRYRRQISSVTNEPGAPLHDEFSHGADAFRYMAVAADRMTNEDLVIGDPYAGFRRHG
jgi:phage terminase large subunit